MRVCVADLPFTPPAGRATDHRRAGLSADHHDIVAAAAADAAWLAPRTSTGVVISQPTISSTR